jgi:hypothetical protein
MKPPAIRSAALPADALLDRYQQSGDFTDCWTAEMPRAVSLAEFITAFYNSAAFRPERWLLGAVLGKGASAADVARLAAAETERFSAWSLEARAADQILLCDYQGRTRSWLMVEPLQHGTRLYFGSAVVATKSGSGSIVFRALLGFHGVYSHLLLRSAAKALMP